MEMIIKGSLSGDFLETSRLTDRIIFNPRLTASFRQTQHFFIKYYKRITTCVCHLFGSSDPSAVLFKIPQLIVMAIEFVKRRWSSAHIFKKFRKISPFITNRYTSSSVMMKGFAIWICRSIEHPLPTYILRRSTVSPSVTVSNRILLTSTRLGNTQSQLASHHGGIVSALTLAQPLNFSIQCVLSASNNRQQSKSSSNQIDNTTSSMLITNAATRPAMSIFQIYSANNNTHTAITYAMPFSFTRWCILSTINNSKTSEFSTNQIKGLHMDKISHMAASVQHWQS